MTEYPGLGVRGVDARFGRRVRAERERRRISQQQMVVNLAAAHEVRWHQSTVTKVENGDRPVRLSEALAIADVLGVSLEDLLDDPDSPGARGRRSERLQGQLAELFRVNLHVAMRTRELEDELADIGGEDDDMGDDDTEEDAGGEHRPSS